MARAFDNRRVELKCPAKERRSLRRVIELKTDDAEHHLPAPFPAWRTAKPLERPGCVIPSACLHLKSGDFIELLRYCGIACRRFRPRQGRGVQAFTALVQNAEQHVIFGLQNIVVHASLINGEREAVPAESREPRASNCNPFGSSLRTLSAWCASRTASAHFPAV